jgi:hypothetical protein
MKNLYFLFAKPKFKLIKNQSIMKAFLKNLHALICLIAYFFLISGVSLNAQDYEAGITYFDDSAYVEYFAGNLPLVISVPHGGYLNPESIPNRNCDGCIYGQDQRTQEIGRGILEAIFEETGCYPHVVINLLHRRKFDANRNIVEAADGNIVVEQSWYAYHSFIGAAKAKINDEYGPGLFVDIHGHYHSIQRIELGYGLFASELQLSDEVLNTNTYINYSTIRSLAGDNLQGLSHAELLRGSLSMGSRLEDSEYPAVPSNQNPYPLPNEPYFSGGYNTLRHGSMNGGSIDGIQVEINNFTRLYDSLRIEFIDSMAVVLLDFLDTHYYEGFVGQYCSLITSVDEKEVDANHLLIYPNPNTGLINIDLGSLTNVSIKVINLSGQLIYYKENIHTPIYQFELDAAPGIYIIELSAEGENQQFKLVKN